MPLTPRETATLLTVVERHIATGEPVGASHVARLPSFRVSPATVRNTLAHLTDTGYLAKSHCSSGRTPTDKGYRAFVDALTNLDPLSPAESEELREATSPATLREMAETLATLSQTLAHLSRRVALVGLASWVSPPLRSLHLIRLEGGIALAVIVTQGGLVRNQVIPVAADFTQELMDRVTNYFNHRFSGIPLPTIRKKLADEGLTLSERADLLVRWAGDLAMAIDDAATGAPVMVGGAPNLLAGFGPDARRLREAMDTLAEQSRMTALLAELLKTEGMRYIIGAESGIEGFDDLSVVGRSFAGADGAIGAIGIIGPKCMNYRKAASLVMVGAARIGRRFDGADLH
ncbi:MAG: heat-inducible transcription repressor HrcA [Nitrospinae bacterium]|nr:heat-inducible transcription repressor HrcA [Nitrospinota bacterium]